MAIHFQSEIKNFRTTQPLLLKKWILEVTKREKKKVGQINFVFMSDEDLLQRNREFLSHDYYTDIITFDYSEDQTVSGDVLVSVDRVRENAEKFSSGFDTELRRVMIHGVLHLCGFKDKNRKDQALMRTAEDRCLKLLSSLSAGK